MSILENIRTDVLQFPLRGPLSTDLSSTETLWKQLKLMFMLGEQFRGARSICHEKMGKDFLRAMCHELIVVICE